MKKYMKLRWILPLILFIIILFSKNCSGFGCIDVGGGFGVPLGFSLPWFMIYDAFTYSSYIGENIGLAITFMLNFFILYYMGALFDISMLDDQMQKLKLNKKLKIALIIIIVGLLSFYPLSIIPDLNEQKNQSVVL